MKSIRDTKDTRVDYIYLIVTVLKTKNKYRLRHHVYSLQPNEFAYRFNIFLNLQDWFKRIKEVELPQPQPINLPEPAVLECVVEPDTGTKVLRRLKGE